MALTPAVWEGPLAAGPCGDAAVEAAEARSEPAGSWIGILKEAPFKPS